MSIGWPNTVAWHGKDYILDAAGWGSKDSVDPRGMGVMFVAHEDAHFPGQESFIVHAGRRIATCPPYFSNYTLFLTNPFAAPSRYAMCVVRRI
jgi:hypothetical protein